MTHGIRRNVAKISQAERDKLRDAILQLDMTKLYPDGVSYWDKQDQIHQATHVHGGPAFLPWHRELCNRFEELLRDVDPTVSLHYWDWTTHPRASDNGAGGATDLFTSIFMGSPAGRAGAPFDTFDNNGVLQDSRDQTGNPEDPPQEITRDVGRPAPDVQSDRKIVCSGRWSRKKKQYQKFREALEGAHNPMHLYIGGTIREAHSAFEDPFVFLIHSNVDRLWAMWQLVPGKTWRLDPDFVYGDESNTVVNLPPATREPGILTPLEPWAGNVDNDPRVTAIRPWAPPDNQELVKNSRDPSVVAPPSYDTLPSVTPLCNWAIQLERRCVAWEIKCKLQCKEYKDNGYNKCAEYKDEGYNKCAEYKDEGYNKCAEYKDEGYNKCAEYKDEGYKKCCTWWPCSWLCRAWVWVSNIVCVAWYWVSNIVCVAWYWVSNIVCVAWYWVSNIVCVAWYWVSNIVCVAWTRFVSRICKAFTWVVRIVTCC